MINRAVIDVLVSYNKELTFKNEQIDSLKNKIKEIRLKIGSIDTLLIGPFCLKECASCDKDIEHLKILGRELWSLLTYDQDSAILDSVISIEGKIDA